MARRGPPGMDQSKGIVPMGTHCNVDYFYSFDQEDWHTEGRDLVADKRRALLEKIERQVRREFKSFRAIHVEPFGGVPTIVEVISASSPAIPSNPLMSNQYGYREVDLKRGRGHDSVNSFYALTPANIAAMKRVAEMRTQVEALHVQMEAEVSKMTRLGWLPDGNVDEEPPGQDPDPRTKARP